MAQNALVQSGFVAAAVAVGRGREPEHGVRHDKLAVVFRDAQGLTVENAVQPCRCGWFQQVYLIDQGEPPVFHRQGQRAILEFHVSLFHNVMADEFGKLQPAVADDFKHGKIELSRELFQATSFPEPLGP